MFLAPPTTVLLLARLFNFIHYTVLSAGSDLKTIVVLYDKPSAQLTSDILCSRRFQSLYVTWSTVVVDSQLSTSDFQHGRTITLAILQPELVFTFLANIIENDIILIYPFEMSDEFLAEFEKISNYLSIILVNFVNTNIKVIFRSLLFEQTISLSELQFENVIQTWFYRPFYNMQSKVINVIVTLDPPLTFNTIRTGHLSDKVNGFGGADLYLTQLIADCLNGTAIFHASTVIRNDEMHGQSDEMIDFIRNKQTLPLKEPALPAIKNLDHLSETELVW